jgi:toxin ParE1/3/4
LKPSGSGVPVRKAPKPDRGRARCRVKGRGAVRRQRANLTRAAAHDVAEVDAATARRFIDAVEQAVRLIARQPGIGSPRYAVELDWPGLRTHPVQRFPYLIFYLEQTGHLDVLRVLHAHRDIPGSLQEAATT